MRLFRGLPHSMRSPAVNEHSAPAIWASQDSDAEVEPASYRKYRYEEAGPRKQKESLGYFGVRIGSDETEDIPNKSNHQKKSPNQNRSGWSGKANLRC
jgi:hypothetical protein